MYSRPLTEIGRGLRPRAKDAECCSGATPRTHKRGRESGSRGAFISHSANFSPPLARPDFYDTLRDFTPITLVVRPTTILVVKPEAAVNQGAGRAGRGEARGDPVRLDRFG